MFLKLFCCINVISNDINSLFCRKTLCSKINPAFLHQPLSPPPNKHPCFGDLGITILSNHVQLPEFHKTHSRKSLSQNYVRNSLSWPSWKNFRSVLIDASQQEESITNYLDFSWNKIFFSFQWWIKWVVLFHRLKVMVYYWRNMAQYMA